MQVVMAALGLRQATPGCNPVNSKPPGLRKQQAWSPPCQAPTASAAATAATRRLHRHPAAATRGAAATGPANAADVQADVCILGGGIIGLCTALALLRADPALRVALVDRREPCAGATGAGQGYLWLAHRQPDCPAWELAMRSKSMWQELLAPAVPQLTLEAVEWQACGSMLVASTADESEGLRQRGDMLAAACLEARFLPADQALAAEAAMCLGPDGSALLVPSDAQVNGRAAAAALLASCTAHGARFTPVFNEGAQQLQAGSSGRMEAVQTEAGRRIHAPRGVVVALGAWTGEFLADQLQDPRWAGAFRPRRGLLLEMPRPTGMPPVAHGLMEVGYSKHYSSSSSSSSGAAGAMLPAGGSGAVADVADITFTATTSASGTLLVGSSREFVGFDSTAPEAVVDAIMQRAAHFLPGLAGVRRQDISVRAGPRPYATAGRPMVGPVPSAPGLVVAAGHEGSGLTLAPATAALVCHHVLGRPAQLEAAVIDWLAAKL